MYNKLTGPLGWEILLIKDGESILVAQSTGVQNIDNYSKRDFDRPKRDAYVGMLPPKLAQIMLNLASGSQQSSVCVLDPFCGTGVVLQEALLMGHSVYGTDISEKMVKYTETNLHWLTTNYILPTANYTLEAADATTNKWDFSSLTASQSTLVIVCETYLGKPLTILPEKAALNEIISEANTISENFLKNIASQLKKKLDFAWLSPLGIW